MAERESRAAFDAELDEGDVDPIDGGELHRLFDRVGADVDVAVIPDDVLDCRIDVFVLDDDEDAGWGCAGHVHRRSSAVTWRSTCPEKTWRAVPRMIAWPFGSMRISSTPPGSFTATSVSSTDLPFETATATVAHAPVPHACVMPTPRSHTTRSISVGERTTAN